MSLKLGNTTIAGISRETKLNAHSLLDFKIYKITDKTNGKVYIGQTKNKLSTRLNQHWHHGYGKIAKEMNKKGIDNFTIEQIDHAHSKEEADYKEKMYIKEYKAHINGYNTQLKNEFGKKVICIETGKIYPSGMAVASEFGKTKNAIYNVLNGVSPRMCGLHFAYIDEYGEPIISDEQIKRRKSKRKILCVESNIIFETIKDAKEYYNESSGGINFALKTGRTNNGRHWKYIEE